MNYTTDVELGQKYMDTQTGFVGHAVAVCFYQHGCERVTLKGLNKQGEIVEYGFDSPEVESLATGLRPQAVKTGGPHGTAGAARR